MIRYFIFVYNIKDHNVIWNSLETHEIILKYSNLFDFDQLLISIQIGSIEVTCISHTLNTGKYCEKRTTSFFFSKIIDYSTYQRWFIEINK